MATLTPRLEKILGKLKKQEHSFSGKIQNLGNVWLSRLETGAFLKAHGRLSRKKTRESYRVQPAIDLHYLVPLSLILHLVVFLLLIQIRVIPPVTTRQPAVVVRILDFGQPAAQSRKETARAAPIKATRPAAQTPKSPSPPKTPVQQETAAGQPALAAPIPEPVLQGPRMLAEAHRDTIPSSVASSPESLVQLPTRESRAAEPSFSVRTDSHGTADISVAELAVPEGLRRTDSHLTGAPGDTPSALSSRDFAPYLEMIKKRVQSVWKYPEGMVGSHRVDVIFVLDRAGQLVRSEVVNSTEPGLAASALRAMRIASPFPPIPESLKELSGSPLRIRFNVEFGIKTRN